MDRYGTEINGKTIGSHPDNCGIKNLNRFAYVLLLISTLLHQPLTGQVKNPEMPGIPVIDTDIDIQTFRFRVRITLQGEAAPVDGVMILNSEVLTSADNKSYKLKDISRINITLWEKRTRINKHIFYPVRYELLLRDYKKIVVNGNIEQLNRIRFNSRKQGYVYLYYYDYFKDGRWINSGAVEFNPAISKPSDGCAVSIELIQ